MERMDYYEPRPAGMDRYLSAYGWHFSKKLCEWAVSRMRDRQGQALEPTEKSALIDRLKANGLRHTFDGYDDVYVEAMARSDFYGSSLQDETQLLQYVVDYLDDPDGYNGIALTRFYADCLASGKVILWEEMM